MGLTDKEWRDVEIVVISAIFGLCIMGFFICQGGIREARADAGSSLKDAVAARTKQMDGIALELKEYQQENSKAHAQLMYSQGLIASKLGVTLPEPR